jgi:tRNA-splicing ligase RtcB
MPTHVNDKLISWASDIDPGTIRQAEKTARLPIVEGHVALMPDAHIGIGATVGSVIPTRGAVIPAAVGVDIGCGMVAAELDVTEHQLPDSLEPLLGRIGKVIPAGVGQGHEGASRNADRWLALHKPATALAAKQAEKVTKQFGTLGSGNHFFELCVDERARVWVLLHSGSRGIGTSWRRCTSPRHVAWRRTCSSAWRIPISPTSSRARPSSRPTSGTCCGRRTMPEPTATR